MSLFDTPWIADTVAEEFGVALADSIKSQIHTVEDLLIVVLDETQTPQEIDADWPCRRCRYNLKGIVSSNCPECGERIVRHAKEVVHEVWSRLARCLPAIDDHGITLNPQTRFSLDLGA